MLKGAVLPAAGLYPENELFRQGKRFKAPEIQGSRLQGSFYSLILRESNAVNGAIHKLQTTFLILKHSAGGGDVPLNLRGEEEEPGRLAQTFAPALDPGTGRGEEKERGWKVVGGGGGLILIDFDMLYLILVIWPQYKEKVLSGLFFGCFSE